MKSLRHYLPESFLVELTDGPNDSISPVNGGNADKWPDTKDIRDGRELEIGDVVRITGNVNHSGKKGRVDDFPTRNGEYDKSFVVVDFGEALNKDGEKIGKKSYHSSDVEYDDYGDDESETEEESYAHQLRNLRAMAGYK